MNRPHEAAVSGIDLRGFRLRLDPENDQSLITSHQNIFEQRGITAVRKVRDPRDHDPTWHSALNDERQACIGGSWRQCRIQPRRLALRGLLDEEEPTARFHDGKQIRRRAGLSRLRTYQNRRSGVQTAYRETFIEANRHANPAFRDGLMAANRTLFY